MLLALRNAAKFYRDGKEFSVAGPDLMATAKPYYIYPGFAFVAYPNRDSTPFRERYNIPEAQDLVRGTLRYQGFPEMIKALVDIDFLSDEPRETLNSPIAWKEATQQILGAASSSEKDLEAAISSKTAFATSEDRNRIISGLRWIGIFSDEKITPRGNPLDTLCATLEKKMQYGPEERDMVMLQHKFGIKHKDGSQETRTSTMCEYGVPGGYSAMAKTVGVPCGVAVKLVLDGTISEKVSFPSYSSSDIEMPDVLPHLIINWVLRGRKISLAKDLETIGCPCSYDHGHLRSSPEDPQRGLRYRDDRKDFVNLYLARWRI